jgi:nucleotidyltransferase/DNA polymerase involved in DNA repair
MPVRVIGHLDADCFYVSAERVRDYFLCGKPVGVLGNQGACVIAKSYEMKACGVKTGEPIWEARVKCPEGIYVKRDFR